MRWPATGSSRSSIPQRSFSADILEKEFVDWVEGSHLLKRAFREVAVIGGLVERAHPGKRKTGKQVTFSTDLIYDVLSRYEPDICCSAPPGTTRGERMTDLGRLARLSTAPRRPCSTSSSTGSRRWRCRC